MNCNEKIYYRLISSSNYFRCGCCNMTYNECQTGILVYCKEDCLSSFNEFTRGNAKHHPYLKYRCEFCVNHCKNECVIAP